MSIDPSANIHPSSVIEDGAVIGANVTIGPLCVVGAEVTLGAGVTLKSHVAVDGWTEIGADTVIFPFASIGHIPQDLKFGGERTKLEIGERNRIREHVTMNPGTVGGGGLTKVGNDGLYMMGVHVGHDCIVGNGVILANNASLGGHCIIGDNVVIGALAGVHQFCRVGRGAMIGGLAAVVADVIPMGMVQGDRANLDGLNLVGLKRAGVDKAQIHGLRAAFKSIFTQGAKISDAVAEAKLTHAGNPLVQEVISFIEDETLRSLTTPRQN
ncbi:acyl-[acyl-carrier-protein]--UDP-N-acetylglucosamine O-acyltransferase [Amylibacter marinus]|uniref:Acyl-[acyl-carrier-protein]--UDP-N-acetylglucosamine O-acyltransferase n=1 Tax=Amylibacter marinus TaxID=1475483 RepID=A0ABQ5VSF8_9RHOB|nr:acyl-ACP--UDP-N-acetylglucosamine O-acyltransferase [Amylibacter marinus]GLQ34225.1 acyl-[acyl-carrier-protein]--UDP-N-acetylglucosamine O-acyltransferase [Amylibacter marinus]